MRFGYIWALSKIRTVAWLQVCDAWDHVMPKGTKAPHFLTPGKVHCLPLNWQLTWHQSYQREIYFFESYVHLMILLSLWLVFIVSITLAVGLLLNLNNQDSSLCILSQMSPLMSSISWFQICISWWGIPDCPKRFWDPLAFQIFTPLETIT